METDASEVPSLSFSIAIEECSYHGTESIEKSTPSVGGGGGGSQGGKEGRGGGGSGGRKEEKEEEEEEEKIPHMCRSIGHQSLWGPRGL